MRAPFPQPEERMVVRATVNKHQPKPRFPTIVTATVFKEIQDTRVGIGFAVDHGRVRISSLSAGGLFSQTGLRVGDVCLSINDSVDLPSHVEAAQAVRQADGEVTVTAARGAWSPDVVLATVPKRDVGTKTGVVFSESFPNATVRIRRTVPGSLFEHSDLRRGDIVHTVNGISPGNVTQAANLVRASKGAVTIVAFSPVKARIQAVEFVFHKDYDIDWISDDECEVSLARNNNHSHSEVRFVLLFSSEQNTATYLDVGKGPGGDPKHRRDVKVEFAKKLLLVNDILADAKDAVAMAGSCTSTVPVLAELIDEPPSASDNSFLKDLEKLASLRSDGFLNESEFDAAKARLLGLAK